MVLDETKSTENKSPGELENKLARGSVLDNKFEIEEFIGRGAHGVVYRARHRFLDGLFALKILDPLPGKEAEKLEQRFQREAAVLSTLEHPNIVKFHAFGNANGSMYMALELLSGASLSQIIKQEGALSERRALPLFEDICQGLAFAHQHSIIHRDIKPSNIMVLRPGSGREKSGADSGFESQSQKDSTSLAGRKEYAKLLDFGIFKNISGRMQDLTQTRALIGSTNYMSPEQCQAKEIDGRSDIYSFGCLMYECLVGTAPFAAESELAVLHKHISEAISSVPAKHGISKELEASILKCLAKDPQDRYDSAESLLASLKAAKGRAIVKAKKEGDGKFLKLSALLILAILLPAVLLWQWQKHNVSDFGKGIKQRQFRKQDVPEPRADRIHSFQKTEDWLGASDYETTPLAKLLKAYCNDLMLRAEIGIKGQPDFILDNVHIKNHIQNKSLDSIASQTTEHLELLWYLSLLQHARGDISKAEQTCESIEKDLRAKPSDKVKNAVNSLLSRSRYDLLLGNFDSAHNLALNALELAAEKPQIQGNCRELLAKIQYEQGDFDKSRATAAQALENLKPRILEGQIGQAENELFDLMNTLKMSSLLSDFTANLLADGNSQRMNENFMDMNHLAIAFKAWAIAEFQKGNYGKAFIIGKKALGLLYKKNPPDSTIGDELLCISARAAIFAEAERLGKLRAPLDKEGGTPYLDPASKFSIEPELEEQIERRMQHLKVISELRYLGGFSSIFNALSEAQADTKEMKRRAESELARGEKETDGPIRACEYAQLRLVIALDAMRNKDINEAKANLEKAILICSKQSSFRSKYLLMLCSARLIQIHLHQSGGKEEMQNFAAIQEIRNRISAKSAKDSDSAESNKTPVSQPLVFLLNDLYFQALAFHGNSDLEKSMARHEKLLEKHLDIPVNTIDDYAEAALAQSRECLQSGKPDSALKHLKAALAKVEQFRASKIQERKKLLEQILTVCQIAPGAESKLSYYQDKLSKLKQTEKLNCDLDEFDAYKFLKASPEI